MNEKELAERQHRIETRIANLQARRVTDEVSSADERLALAYQHVLEAQTAAYQALKACRDACLRGALAHDRAADVHQRAADAGSGERATHRQQAEFHRAAGQAERRKAEQITADIAEAEAVLRATQSDGQSHLDGRYHPGRTATEAPPG